MTTIDQQTRRRTGRTGLTALDPTKACPGYVLYAPMFGDGQVYLIDLESREVHRWELPYPPGLYGYLLPNGNTLITEGMSGRMFQVTPQGQVVWEYINPYFHQDPDGVEVNVVFRATHYTADQIPWLR